MLHDAKLKIKCGPYPKGRKDITAVETFAMAVTAGSRNPKPAMDLVKFISLNDAAQTLITEVGWGSPVIPKVAEDAFVTKGDPYGKSYFLQELKSGNGRLLPQTASLWTEIEEALRAGYEPMYAGKMSALEAAKRVKPNVERLLARVK